MKHLFLASAALIALTVATLHGSATSPPDGTELAALHVSHMQPFTADALTVKPAAVAGLETQEFAASSPTAATAPDTEPQEVLPPNPTLDIVVVTLDTGELGVIQRPIGSDKERYSWRPTERIRYRQVPTVGHKKKVRYVDSSFESHADFDTACLSLDTDACPSEAPPPNTAPTLRI